MKPYSRRKLQRILPVLVAFVLPNLFVGLFLTRLPRGERQVALIPEAKDRVATENELFKTLLQLAGGSLLIGGFYFTWKTIYVNQEGQITERFNKAIDHLGGTSLAIRLGGIYALARIAADSEKDAGTVAEVFAAVVRESSKDASSAKLAPEVACILTLLGSQEWAKGIAVNLAGCNLRHMELKDADLRGWIFRDTDLEDATLERSRLDGATFLGANCANSYMRGCSLQRADLTAANFDGASLRDAQIEHANLLGARFNNCSLLGTNFRDCRGAIRPNFEGAILDDRTTLPEFKSAFD